MFWKIYKRFGLINRDVKGPSPLLKAFVITMTAEVEEKGAAESVSVGFSEQLAWATNVDPPC